MVDLVPMTGSTAHPTRYRTPIVVLLKQNIAMFLESRFMQLRNAATVQNRVVEDQPSKPSSNFSVFSTVSISATSYAV